MPLNMELKSQDSHVKGTPVRVGWGQLSSQNSHPLTPCYAAESKADLVALQNSLPGPPSYWDPLNLGGNATLLEDYGFDYEKEDGTMVSFRIDTEEKAIGWFRHAEIKHGRVAMAAVLGFIAQCTPTVSGEHTIAPYRGYIAGCTPQEQWDNIPLYGKLQIITLVGMLESYGEGAGSPEGYVHYTKGGKPGYYPPIKGRGSPWGGQILFNLWDPFGISKVQNLSEESKARRLQVELQNGRLAMIGIMGFLAASSVPGSVPFLASIPGYPQYSGNVMVPFSNDFSIFFVQPTSLKSLQNSDPLTPCDATKADLVELQNSLPGPPGYWDPLDLAESTILAGYGIDTVEANIGWWRHAEIKHGRVAMAAVLGFIAQCTPLVSGEHSVAPYRGYVAGCTPQEQWDNIPLLGKLQIVVLIGMLESYGEGAGDPEGYVHYTKGGKPGYYPPIKGRVAGQIGLNLWDPFEFPGGPKNLSEESKARRLQAELQNGRLAMIGIMGFLAASSVPGSVPFLAAIPGYPQYSGNVMVPFSNDFSLFGS